ncbi:hypothetical protein WN51_13608 [Melipona quadrifasciata]|uniref:Uncharacterized protein n=1 Tax=Melipona quadrifasciata TaxID=166423 RepID=A0A0M8ZZS6_9HYME|nr:hypothetical protein WN51_13608 [Melipona quadrifasciata]
MIKLQNLYSVSVNNIKHYFKRIIKHVDFPSVFHSTCCLNSMEDDEFLEDLQYFKFILEDEQISFDESDENSDDDEMMTAREDSDSSNEEWNDANNVTIMKSLDHESDIFHTALEERCSSSSTFPKQTEKSKQNNFFHDEGNDHSLKTESHIEHKNENKIQEGKRSYPQNDSTKYKSHSSKTSKKKSKRKNIKYKKTTQTNNHSSDDEVEVIPIKAKRYRKRRHRSRIDLEIRQFQNKNTNEELNYMADNEDSIDGLSQIRDEQISLFQTPFSSINSDFENRAFGTFDMNTIAEQWSTISPDRINNFLRCSCACPTFQELRQNPLSYIFYQQWMLLSLNNDPNFFPLRQVTTIPPAPSPMRHLYYEYPEFMTVPNRKC